MNNLERTEVGQTGRVDKSITKKQPTKMTFEDWIKYGISMGWCGPPVCSTHDGVPTSASEDEEWENGSDPCIHVIRMYEDAEQKKGVEENHSPSQWRDHYSEKN